MNADATHVNWKKTGWIAGAVSLVAGLAAFAANLTTVAGWFGVGPESEDDESPGITIAAQYVRDCEADDYTREQCETSQGLDPSDTWTGELFEDEDTTEHSDGPDRSDGPDETDDLVPSAHDVYIDECEEDGYGQIDCEVSWENDPGGEWTGLLFGPYDTYVRECQDDGYSWEECDTSWAYDPGTEWTGTLYDDGEPTSEYDVYIQDCQDDGYTWDACENSYYNDPGNVWTGTLY